MCFLFEPLYQCSFLYFHSNFLMAIKYKKSHLTQLLYNNNDSYRLAENKRKKIANARKTTIWIGTIQWVGYMSPETQLSLTRRQLFLTLNLRVKVFGVTLITIIKQTMDSCNFVPSAEFSEPRLEKFITRFFQIESLTNNNDCAVFPQTFRFLSGENGTRAVEKILNSIALRSIAAAILHCRAFPRVNLFAVC